MMTRGMLVTAVWLLIAGWAWAYEYAYDPSDFATGVVEYVQGGPIPADFYYGIPFNDPQAALGRPTVDTTNDSFIPPPSQRWPVVPAYGAFRMYFDFQTGQPVHEIVSIGQGGRLILEFDHPVQDDPANPCGVDFIIFGNTVQTLGRSSPQSPLQTWVNGDPSARTFYTTDVFAEGGVVSVSQTGPPNYEWHTFVNRPAVGYHAPAVDGWVPTLGRVYDPDHPFTGFPLGAWNLWWGLPTDPTLPFNPALTPADFLNRTVAQACARYGYTAGGTGFDLSDLDPPLAWFRYIKIENADPNTTPEIDAISDVRPRRFPDFDCDTDVDHDDVEQFEQCATSPGAGPPPSEPAWCLRADLDADGDVDQSDFGLLQRCLSGQDVRADLNCVE